MYRPVRLSTFLALLLSLNAAVCQQNPPTVASISGSQKLNPDSKPAADFVARWVGQKRLDITAVHDLSMELVHSQAPAGQAACEIAANCAQWKAAVSTNQTLVQNGASAAASGSTSTTEKPGIPALLGVALENGAIKDNVSGNTMTLTTTPMALLEGFLGAESGKCIAALCRQLGASATFNVSSSTSSEGATGATRKNISQWQLKYSFRDSSEYSAQANKIFIDKLQPALQEEAKALSSPGSAALSRLDTRISQIIKINPDTGDLEIGGTVVKIPDSEQSMTSDQQRALVSEILNQVRQDQTIQTLAAEAAQNTTVAKALQGLQAAHAASQQAYKAYQLALASVKPRWSGAATFNQQYPTTTVTTSSGATKTQPTYLAPGVIVSFDPTAAAVKNNAMPSLTFNAGGSFYPNPLISANEATFRGATTALQVQWTLGRGPFLKDPNDKGQVTFSLNGNYSRLQENQHQAGKKADIAIGNLKWEIPLPGGITFPLSLTVASATDQVRETYVRGNFGISFDLDKLQSLLKAAH